MKLKLPITLFLFVFTYNSFSQSKIFSKEDTLWGSNTAYRSWWDVTHYNLSVQPDYIKKSISGNNIITYKTIADSLPFVMQIDLQDPLQVDSVFVDRIKFTNYKKEKNRWMLSLQIQEKNTEHTVQLFFHGKPKVAVNPPWDGGFVWKKDSLGNPWMSVACQGAGASVWFPCKDIQSEEPENGAILTMTVPDTLLAIGNGKLIDAKKNGPGLITYSWEVKNIINSYDIIPYIGKYTHLQDSVMGENGKLMTDYWVLNYHVQKAKQHLKPNVIKTLKCLEHWFGPYPFYDDTYKIVEAPYLGMEHQSNVAYGNRYLNGYAGKDLSKTGWGLKWDFIVVHETAHEWFGNSITAKDVADNWIHEGFASYAEVLFTECEFGKEAGNDYCEGVKKSISNDIPVIGKYDVRVEGSGDMYNKGSNVIHMIRQLVDDDEKFRLILRDISKTFYHRIITTKEFEDYLILKTGKDLQPLFDQYLRTTKIPRLEYKLTKNKLEFRYSNCNKEFNMPVKITTDKEFWIYPTTEWKTITLAKASKNISLNRNVYVDLVK
ncbi:MAG: M1 family metallopeptidase [Burkholderiales bacterium]|nr:M1 family metallopeptidase [Bacteroidia bacterium]